MKKFILFMMMSFWFSIVSIQIYSMSLEQALNQFSTSLRTLTNSFKGEAVPPSTKTELEQLEEQLLVMIQRYINNLQNHVQFAKIPDFIDKSEEYLRTGGQNLTIRLWYELILTNFNLSKFDPTTYKFINAANFLTHLETNLINPDLEESKDYSQEAEKESYTKIFYDRTVASLKALVTKLEQAATKPSELEQEEQKLLTTIRNYVKILPEENFTHTYVFLAQAKDYIDVKKGTDLDIQRWYYLIYLDTVLKFYKDKTIDDIPASQKGKIQDAQDLISSLKTPLTNLQNILLKEAYRPKVSEFSDKVVKETKALIARFEQEVAKEQETTKKPVINEEQLLEIIQKYINNLKNKKELNDTQDFLKLAAQYLNEGGDDPYIILWHDLILSYLFIEKYQDKEISDIVHKGEYANTQSLIKDLNDQLKNLDHSKTVAKEPNTKKLYDSLVSSLNKLKQQATDQFTIQQLFSETKEFEEALAPYNEAIVEKFIESSDAILQNKKLNEIIADKKLATLKFYNLNLQINSLVSAEKEKTASQMMRDYPGVFTSIPELITKLTNYLNSLEKYKQIFFTEKKYGTTKALVFTDTIIENLKAWIKKLNQEAQEDATKTQLTQLENELKQFIVINFSMPLAQMGDENLSQWKKFEADYKKLQNLATQTNTPVNRLIEFWYIRGYLKVNFEKSNLLQTTFALMSNTKDSSIEASVTAFDDLIIKYNDPDFIFYVIGSDPKTGKLTQPNYLKFSNSLSTIKDNLTKQKELISYIRTNFSNDVVTFGNKKSNITMKKVQDYKKLYDTYSTIETDPVILKPYSYWYYRSILLLGNVNQIANIFNKTEGFTRTNLIPEFYAQYNKIKPTFGGLGIVIPEKELVALYLLQSKAQAETGDNLIKAFVQKETMK